MNPRRQVVFLKSGSKVWLKANQKCTEMWCKTCHSQPHLEGKQVCIIKSQRTSIIQYIINTKGMRSAWMWQRPQLKNKIQSLTCFLVVKMDCVLLSFMFDVREGAFISFVYIRWYSANADRVKKTVLRKKHGKLLNLLCSVDWQRMYTIQTNTNWSHELHILITVYWLEHS